MGFKRKLIYMHQSTKYKRMGWNLGRVFWKDYGDGVKHRVRYIYKHTKTSGFKQPTYKKGFGRLW